MATPPPILILAGEASGDMYGGQLARELRQRIPGVRLHGLGGTAMEGEGVHLFATLDELAVMGFAEPLRHLPALRRINRRIMAFLRTGQVDLVLPIDFSGFNMGPMKRAHSLGVPVLWYVAPKVWAWRERRARALARYAADVAVILPFEERFLRDRGVRATYVGNPLMDRPEHPGTREAFCARWSLDAERPILGMLPGSRRQEIDRHLALFTQVAGAVTARHPEVQPVLARAPHLPHGLLGPSGLTVVDDTRGVQRHSAAALVKSGTGTLETAIEGTPQVVAYRTSALTWWLVRRAVRLEHWALPNLVAGARVVPEFIQHDMTVSALSTALSALLDPGSRERREQIEGLRRVRELVGGPGAAGRVADMAAALVAGPR